MNAPAEIDAEGRLAQDLTCARCGYNLRGLRTDSRCCECGQPVAWSLLGSPLAGADQRWLRRVSTATGWLTLLLLWLWLPLAWPFVLVAGWWAASPNPARGHPAAWTSLILRLLLIIILILAPTVTFLAARPSPFWRPDEIIPPVLVTVAALFGWTTLLLPGLCRHVGGKRLQRSVRLAFVLWGTALLGVAAASAVSLASPSGSNDVIAALLGIMGALALLFAVALVPLILMRVWRELDIAVLLAQSS